MNLMDLVELLKNRVESTVADILDAESIDDNQVQITSLLVAFDLMNGFIGVTDTVTEPSLEYVETVLRHNSLTLGDVGKLNYSELLEQLEREVQEMDVEFDDNVKIIEPLADTPYYLVPYLSINSDYFENTVEISCFNCGVLDSTDINGFFDVGDIKATAMMLKNRGWYGLVCYEKLLDRDPYYLLLV